MIVTCYKAAQYGFKLRGLDRDKYISKTWKELILELPIRDGYSEAVCNISKPSFWNGTCHEIIKKEIAVWLKENDYDKWSYRKPYKFEVVQIYGNRFRLVEKINNEINGKY